jgi:hypothetical protein
MQIILLRDLMVSNTPMGGSHPRAYVLEFHTPYDCFIQPVLDYHITCRIPTKQIRTNNVLKVCLIPVIQPAFAFLSKS